MRAISGATRNRLEADCADKRRSGNYTESLHFGRVVSEKPTSTDGLLPGSASLARNFLEADLDEAAIAAA